MRLIARRVFLFLALAFRGVLLPARGIDTRTVTENTPPHNDGRIGAKLTFLVSLSS
jgi:hypothetical protein